MSWLVFTLFCCITCIQSVSGCSVNSTRLTGSVFEHAPVRSVVLLQNEANQSVNFVNETLSLSDNLDYFFNISALRTVIVADTTIDRHTNLTGYIVCNGTTNITTVISVLNINSANNITFYGLPYTVDVNETTPEMEIIYSVNATDEDVPDTSIFYNLSGDDNFTINQNTGKISISELGHLDYRASKQHIMNIIVMSIGFDRNGVDYNQTKNTSFVVTVLNTDYNPPKFSFESCANNTGTCGIYTSKIETGKMQDVMVKPNNITAVDLDSNKASITYSFVWGQPENYFDYLAINETTGLVYMLEAIPEMGEFNIYVEAKESTGKTSTTTFSVTAHDVTVQPKTYPYYVVNGLIGGLVACFFIAFVLGWCLIWKFRQKPIKKVENPVQMANQPQCKPSQNHNRQRPKNQYEQQSSKQIHNRASSPPPVHPSAHGYQNITRNQKSTHYPVPTNPQPRSVPPMHDDAGVYNDVDIDTEGMYNEHITSHDTYEAPSGLTYQNTRH